MTPGGYFSPKSPHGDMKSSPRLKTAKSRWGLVLACLALLPSALSAQQRPAPRHAAYAVNGMDWPVGDPLHITEYSQPFVYRQWWAEIATCEGFPVPDSAMQHSVQFFSVPASLFAFNIGSMLAGTYDQEPAIYMGAPYVWEEGIVKHEMLHVILHWAGFELQNFHPTEFFERCGIHIYGNPHP